MARAKRLTAGKQSRQPWRFPTRLLPRVRKDRLRLPVKTPSCHPTAIAVWRCHALLKKSSFEGGQPCECVQRSKAGGCSHPVRNTQYPEQTKTLPTTSCPTPPHGRQGSTVAASNKAIRRTSTLRPPLHRHLETPHTNEQVAGSGQIGVGPELVRRHGERIREFKCHLSRTASQHKRIPDSSNM